MEMDQKVFFKWGPGKLFTYLEVQKDMFGLLGGACLVCLFLCFLIFIFLGDAMNKNL